MKLLNWYFRSGILQYIYIIMKAFNGFLMIERQMTLKDECGYISLLLANFIGYSDAFLVDIADTTRL